MAINLKQISVSDSDNIKLDKVNYNFDQLISNGGGPQGTAGPKGDAGFQGVNGPIGPQGYQGNVGPQGIDGPTTTTYWKNIQGSSVAGNLNADTILPIHDLAAAVPMLYPPVISIGFLSTDSQYNQAQPINAGQSPYQWIINRKNHFASNLRFTNDSTTNYVDFIMDTGVSTNTFTITFGEVNTSKIVWYAGEHVFKSNITGTNLLTVDDLEIIYNVGIIYNDTVEINQPLTIGNAGAANDKIAVAASSTGEVVFKTAKEIGGVVPYGTIISMLPSVFSDGLKFINSETIDASTGAALDLPIPIRVGGGIGDYEGWYLCNGKTWTDGTNTHVSPDLNSFSYTIADNPGTIDPDGQGSAAVTNDETAIIGGADASLTAAIITGSTYLVQGTVDTTSESVGVGDTFNYISIKKLPQIIYLGTADMYWTDKGTGQAPNGINTYSVTDTSSTSLTMVPNPSDSTTAAYDEGDSYSFTMDVYADDPSAVNEWDSLPPTSAFTSTTSGYSVTNVASPGGPAYIILTITVTYHGAPNEQRDITFDSTGYIV